MKTILNQRGVSLLELVMVILLISLTLVAMSPMFQRGIRGQFHYQDATLAISLAEEKLEQLRGTSFANLTSQAKASVSGYSKYTIQTTVTTVETTLKQVDVVVAWKSVEGLSRTYQLSTLRANY